MKENDHKDRLPEYRKIYIGSDHTGYAYADDLMKLLREKGYDVVDCIGKDRPTEDDYPDRAFSFYRKMQEEQKEGEAILLCGSGEGMCIVANKFPGIRAVEVGTIEEAQRAREHNGSNVLCLGSRELSREKIENIVLVWLDSGFSQEVRHKRRRDKIGLMERAGSIYDEKKSFYRKEYIIPAILTQDRFEAEHRLERMVGKVHWVQIDIADETFTKTKTFAPDDVQVHAWPFLFEAHLMVDNPIKYIEACRRSGYNRVVFHHEMKEESLAVIEKIHEAGMEAGIAIGPKTPLVVLDEYMQKVDSLLLVAVPPGKSGQTMDKDTLERMRILRKKAPRSLPIFVDGGVNEDNIQEVIHAGATGVCMGSALFQESDDTLLNRLQELLKK